MTLFDTHAHLDDARFDEDRDKLISNLPANGVVGVVNASSDLASSRRSIELANSYPFIWAAVGVHPQESGSLPNDYLDTVANMVRANPRVRAIGEIGLDYHYDTASHDVQQKRFREQLDLARALNLPVVVHEREAHEDSLKIIRDFPGIRGVYHCYSGSAEQAKVLFRLGWYVSFTGVVTFHNARKTVETAAIAPEDRFMIETDCPYMAPVPHRGERNDSSLVRFMAKKIAEIRGCDPEYIAEITCRNARTFFEINENL